jgi:hypothetical protein
MIAQGYAEAMFVVERPATPEPLDARTASETIRSANLLLLKISQGASEPPAQICAGGSGNKA